MVLLVIKKELDTIKWFKVKVEGLFNFPYTHLLTFAPSHLPFPTLLPSYPLTFSRVFPSELLKRF